VAKATKRFEHSLFLPDGTMLHIRIWDVPEPVPPSRHRLKYSCFYGRPGERAVLYDNERGKGDHRHYGEIEEPYEFRTFEDLIADFLADVSRITAGG